MDGQHLAIGQMVHGFQVERVQQIPELRSEAVLFTHSATRARVLHLYNDDPNNLFCIAFRTPVRNNTGVPHILEHSVLCGSRHYRVKDPFQEMLKGSLYTFLNAMTYPDKTVYPVSSQVERDFYNLIDVYCDAVFHPLLSENTFYQEGWHFDVENPAGPIDIKGIVYNEMKGVYSDFRSHVARKTMNALFPDTVYSWESGGEPEHITELDWKQFRDFHAKYYHPSNALIFLYGNLPSEKTLRLLHEKYLHEYRFLAIDSTIEPQPRWDTPRSIAFEAPAPAEENGTATVAMAWIFGPSYDPVTAITGTVLWRYLLGTEMSPLKRALIDSRLGEDLDDISGFDTDLLQATFTAGLRKTKPEYGEKISSIILDTLRSVVEKGFDDDLLEGALRQTEFRFREIANTHYPYNLALAERCFRSWLYDHDPLAHLAFEKPLSFVKDEKRKGHSYFADAIKNMLFDNPHRLTVTISASSDMGKRLETQTQQHVAALSRDITPEHKKRYHELTRCLLEEQKKPNDPAAVAELPKIAKSDLPAKNQRVPLKKGSIGSVPLYMHPIFTSGIAYVDIGFDFSIISPELLPYLPLHNALLTRCGAAGLNYQEMARRIALATGGIAGSLLAETRSDSPSALTTYSFFHGKALPERFEEMTGIFADLFHKPDLTNAKQIKDLLLEMRNDLSASIMYNGYVIAAGHAASRLSASAMLDEIFDGIAQLRFLSRLIAADDQAVIAERINQIHQTLMRSSACVVSMTADNPEALVKPVERLIAQLPEKHLPRPPLPSPAGSTGKPLGIEISSSVNFVARSWKIERRDPSDVATLSVMSKNLSTNYLWEKVRMQGGAYGGRAFFSSGHPVFSCASYRDPNLSATLGHFEKALEEMARGLSHASVDQSIIGTIGRIDEPRSPHGKGYGETLALLNGSSVERRQAIRDNVLAATPEMLAKKAGEILDQKATAITILGSAAAFEKAAKDGISMDREPLLGGV